MMMMMTYENLLIVVVSRDPSLGAYFFSYYNVCKKDRTFMYNDSVNARLYPANMYILERWEVMITSLKQA